MNARRSPPCDSPAERVTREFEAARVTCARARTRAPPASLGGRRRPPGSSRSAGTPYAVSEHPRRKVPEASVEELAATGFFKLLQPRAHGGHAADPVAFCTAVKEIAKACGSTGWVASVVGVHPWHVALYEPKAQEEVWGADPDARICSSYAPTGKVTPVDGGFTLTGRRHFSSGCDHTDRALLGGLVTDADGRPVDMRTFLVPRTAYRVDDVWDTVGLRGSGSNDVVCEDVFVPDHRALSFGPVTALDAPGLAANPEPLYRLPYASVFTTTISTPIVGIAEGAYEGHVAATRERFRVSYGQQVAEDPFAQVRIARAGDIGTKGGLVTDGDGRVLREDGGAIEGLYAAGNCSAAVMGETYPGPGATIGPAMAFAWAAVNDIAGSSTPTGSWPGGP
ncbi:FAD-binding protein [Streptomyces sp. NPDC048370]|uniref:FAD-binding protein n=1 Tax=Streptomyces sp. NPDC048370 TaxID=3365540 RepID=UPI0037234B8E